MQRCMRQKGQNEIVGFILAQIQLPYSFDKCLESIPYRVRGNCKRHLFFHSSHILARQHTQAETIRRELSLYHITLQHSSTLSNSTNRLSNYKNKEKPLQTYPCSHLLRRTSRTVLQCAVLHHRFGWRCKCKDDK